MTVFELGQIYSLPIDIITAANRQWRDAIIEHDTKWHWVEKQFPTAKIDNYIQKQYPELKNQFEWEGLTGNERMAKKFGGGKGYQGHYDCPRYDSDLDPFYD